jgi:hypothetical protein
MGVKFGALLRAYSMSILEYPVAKDTEKTLDYISRQDYTVGAPRFSLNIF